MKVSSNLLGTTWGGNRDTFSKRKKKYDGHQKAQAIPSKEKDDSHKAIPMSIYFPLPFLFQATHHLTVIQIALPSEELNVSYSLRLL